MLHAIAKAVKDNNADIGFGFDGDGDRCGVIDDKGNEIYSDKIGLLIARNLATNIIILNLLLMLNQLVFTQKIKFF